MGIIRWDPFSELENVRRMMKRWLDEALERSPASEGDGYVTPTMDVIQREKSVDIIVELPGLEKKDVSIELDNERLVIEAEKKVEELKENDRYILKERPAGRFRRVLTLADTVDAEKAEAEFKDGVLRITLPVKETKKNVRKLTVK